MTGWPGFIVLYNTCRVSIEGEDFLSNIAIIKIKMMNEYFTQCQLNPPNTDIQ